ncbi:MAG: DegT/DnrJ/EryC1/StrS aminotransferase [Nitrospiraceae bacterium]|nr:DegT/DnrJ/EryC1/StrS aminotransferase [Nitrospiraceae bacterium]
MSQVLCEELAVNGGVPVRTVPLPWELPGSHWIGEEEMDLVGKVLSSRSPFRYYGPHLEHMVDTLEQEFAARLGRRYALATGSGTAALMCALGALDVGPGDEVLLSGYLWVSCLGAIVRLGAIPRLVDIDDTFCMSPTDLSRKISSRSKALLLVHMSGAPGDLDAILPVARDAGLPVIEDCAQANGASYRGKPVGSQGDLAIFSFQLNKNMTAGEGGIVVCNDEHFYKRCFAIHDMGYARNAEGRLDPDDEQYQLWGIGARMSELAGAMSLAQLRKLDSITGAMRESKYAIRREIEQIEGLQCRRIVDPKGDSGPFLIVTLPSAEVCEAFAKALHAEGIRGPEGSFACIAMENWGLHWHWNNLSLVNRRGQSNTGRPWTDPANAFANEYSYERGACPNCDDLASRSILLTIASCLTQGDVSDIVEAYKKVANALL